MNTPYQRGTRSRIANALALLLALCLIALAPALFADGTNSPAAARKAARATNELYIAPPKFETWPALPSSNAMPQPSVSLVPPVPGVLGMPKTTEDKRLFEFRADHVELKTVLAAFAQANNLNIVPDQDVNGEVTIDVKNLTLEQMMSALVEAHDFTWTDDHGLIRVRAMETRTFPVEYLRMIRTGLGTSTATLSSGSGSGGGSGGGSTGGTPTGTSGSDISLKQNNAIDFWKELEDELKAIMGHEGGGSLVINKTAGLIQVTARPSVVKHVGDYLAQINLNVGRQVDLEVKIFDVTLNKGFQFGIDWVQLAEQSGAAIGSGGLTGPMAIGGTALGPNAIGGLNTVGIGLTNFLSANTGNPLVYASRHTQVAVNALAQQGLVEVISQPRLRALNNQTALVTVGTDTPFFTVTSQITAPATGPAIITTSTTVNTITIGTIMSITPQISDDGWITLDISPVITTLVGTETSTTASGTTTAPVVDTKEASTLVRLRDGSTAVLGGLIQTSTAKNENKVPLLGDIPWLGKLFTGKFDSKVKQELVIFVTPTIVH